MYERLAYAALALIPGFLLLDFVLKDRRCRKTRFWRTQATLVTAAASIATRCRCMTRRMTVSTMEACGVAAELRSRTDHIETERLALLPKPR